MKIEEEKMKVMANIVGKSAPHSFTQIIIGLTAKISTDSDWVSFVDPAKFSNESSAAWDDQKKQAAMQGFAKLQDAAETLREQIEGLAGLSFAKTTNVTRSSGTAWDQWSKGNVYLYATFVVNHGNRSTKKCNEFVNATLALVKANQDAIRSVMVDLLSERDDLIRKAEVEARVGRVVSTVLRLEREKAEEIVGYKARKVAAAEAYAREIEALDKLVEEQIVAGRPFRIDETLSYAYESMVSRIGADGVKLVREIALASTVTIPTLMGEDKIPIPIVFDIG